MSSSPTYLDPIVIPLVTGETVLDVGCGYGRWGALIHSNYWEAGYDVPPIVDGIDAFAPNVAFCNDTPFYRHVREHLLPNPIEGQWDTVLACEIIEHIEQARVFEFLDMLERTARRRVIITTPNWPAFRPGAGTKLGYNDYEAHLSYVSRQDFLDRGYRICGAGFGHPEHWIDRGIAGLRSLRARTRDSAGAVAAQAAEAGQPAVPGSARGVLQTLRSALAGVSRFAPSFGNAIVAFKDVG